METQSIELLDEVHDAVPMATNGPVNAVIKFDVTAAAIDEMRTKADSMIIAGPDDKAGYNLVFETRQAVKRQRVAVQNKQKALKRPHIDYNRDVDSAAELLIDPMQQIENDLALKEKAYKDENERLAEEKAKAARIRYATRTKDLQTWGFAFNPELDTYEFGALIINVDDIRDLSDEDYQPTQSAAKELYDLEQKRLQEIELAVQQEAQRIAGEQEAERQRLQAIADQQAEAQRKIDEQQAELKRQQDELAANLKKLQDEKDQAVLNARIDRLVAAGFTRSVGHLSTYYHFSVKLREGVILSFTDEQFDSVIADAVARTAKAHADEKDRIETERLAAEEKQKADKARQKRLKSDKETLYELFRIEERYTRAPLTQPETQELANQYFDRWEALLAEFGGLTEAL